MGVRHVEGRWQERGSQGDGTCEVCWAAKEAGEGEGGVTDGDEEDEGMSGREDEIMGLELEEEGEVRVWEKGQTVRREEEGMELEGERVSREDSEKGGRRWLEEERVRKAVEQNVMQAALQGLMAPGEVRGGKSGMK